MNLFYLYFRAALDWFKEMSLSSLLSTPNLVKVIYCHKSLRQESLYLLLEQDSSLWRRGISL